MPRQVGPYEDNMVDYLHYLTVERGLSANTRTSYRQDLTHFFTYLIDKEKSLPLTQVDRFTIMAFLG
ncbi:site-specific integrase, partial [Lactobacillaceae bacterium KNUT 0156]|nr:site-specific integrase [Weissella cibaria]